ncbi:EAL domain-containing protein [Candidatus Magnetoovum chiemensis]|nr:EAL domain-containing protein [Candidatus Magnetoovum chiemensis]
MSLSYFKISLSEILEGERIVTYFQPIISIRKKAIIGFEGLSRGYCKSSDKIIPPKYLFDEAKAQNKLLELDVLCRRKGLEAFNKDIHDLDKSKMFFLNFEVSLINEGTEAAMSLIELVSQLNIDPLNVIVEIIESRVKDTKALKQFIEVLKYYGFLIALDDVGVGHSNFDRIAMIKPNLIKIDRSIITNIDKDYYKQEIFKALINLCRQIGVLVLAEGVETENEALYSLIFGADMLQGFYFTGPRPIEKKDDFDSLSEKINYLSDKYISYEIDNIIRLRGKHKVYDNLIKLLKDKLRSKEPTQFQSVLEDTIHNIPYIDALYILDEQGFQVTDTVMLIDESSIKSKFFKPGSIGSSHFLKEYYYLLMSTELKKYTTSTYISLATGKLCRTISSVLKRNDQLETFILCIDIIERNV